MRKLNKEVTGISVLNVYPKKIPFPELVTCILSGLVAFWMILVADIAAAQPITNLPSNSSVRIPVDQMLIVLRRLHHDLDGQLDGLDEAKKNILSDWAEDNTLPSSARLLSAAILRNDDVRAKTVLNTLEKTAPEFKYAQQQKIVLDTLETVANNSLKRRRYDLLQPLVAALNKIAPLEWQSHANSIETTREAIEVLRDISIWVRLERFAKWIISSAVASLVTATVIVWVLFLFIAYLIAPRWVLSAILAIPSPENKQDATKVLGDFLGSGVSLLTMGLGGSERVMRDWLLNRSSAASPHSSYPEFSHHHSCHADTPIRFNRADMPNRTKPWLANWFLEKGQTLLILGPGASGKTNLICALLRHYTSQNSAMPMLRLEQGKFDMPMVEVEACKKFAENMNVALPEAIFQKMLGKGLIVILMDGFARLSRDELLVFRSKFQRCPIVVTSRTAEASKLEDTVTGWLGELNPTDARNLVYEVRQAKDFGDASEINGVIIALENLKLFFPETMPTGILLPLLDATDIAPTPTDPVNLILEHVRNLMPPDAIADRLSYLAIRDLGRLASELLRPDGTYGSLSIESEQLYILGNNQETIAARVEFFADTLDLLLIDYTTANPQLRFHYPQSADVFCAREVLALLETNPYDAKAGWVVDVALTKSERLRQCLETFALPSEPILTEQLVLSKMMKDH